jgi:uncharacterized protein
MSAARRKALIAFISITAAVALYAAVSAAILFTALTPLRKPHDQTPVSAGLRAEPITLESTADRTRLAGFFIPAGADRAIVMVHGLDSNCWDGNDRGIAGAYAAHGYSVVVFDLRGQGDSGGKLLGLGWKERNDVRAAVGFLLKKGFRPGRIGIHGSSYGAATALLATADIPEVGAVVADSPFADMRDMMEKELKSKVGNAGFFMPGIILVGKLFFGLDLAGIPPVNAMQKIAPRPVFLLHGEADSRIPVEQSRKLMAASRNPADILWTLPGIEHTKEYNADPAEFMRRTCAFFDRYLK